MKKGGILNPRISELVAKMGHGDMLAITDRGFPLPLNSDTVAIDVSVTRNIPRVMDVLKAVVEELEIQSVLLAKETEEISPQIYKQFLELLKQLNNKGNPIEVEIIPHEDFKHLVLRGAEEGKELKGMIRTGELTPYANIIVISGVPF